MYLNPVRARLLRAGPGAGGVLLEQLWAVFASARQAGAMAAGGPVAGRNGHCGGQRGGPEGICAADGSQPQGGSHWRISKHPAGLVLWGGGVSTRIAAPSQPANGGAPLWPGAAGK